MSDQNLIIRGLGAPYNQEVRVRGVVESIAPHAFAEQRAQVPVLVGDHDVQAFSTTTRLFSYRDGLGFEAMMSWSHPSAIWMARTLRSERWGASVTFASMEADETAARRRITACTISHVSIVPDPAYAGTVCWDADEPMATIPTYLAQIMSRWDTAARPAPYIAFRSSARQGAAPAPAGAAGAGRGHGRPAPKRMTAPPSVTALLASPA